MEYILKQSFDYALIKLYKNYSNIQEKKDILGLLKPDDSTFLGDEEEMELDPHTRRLTTSKVIAVVKRNIHAMRLYPKKTGRKFFYDDGIDRPTDVMRGDERVKIIPLTHVSAIKIDPGLLSGVTMCNDYVFTTREDRHIKHHYNNPFAGLQLIRIERWIRKDGDKITIKLYSKCRTRNVNNIYFTKSSSSTTLTFNLRTGNFLVTGYTQVRKSKVKHFYSNTFSSLKAALSTIYRIESKMMSSSSPLCNDYIKEFDNNSFRNGLKKAFGITTIEYDEVFNVDSAVNKFIDKWIPMFAEIRKIKLPNYGGKLLTNFYPTERYLKKNDRKLIAAILDRFGIKSKITIKLLHENPDLNMITLVHLCQMLGESYPKYIGNVPSKFFDKVKGMNNHDDMYVKCMLLDNENNEYRNIEIKNNEKDSIMKIISDFSLDYKKRYTLLPCNNRFKIMDGNDLLHEISDHFKMLERVKVYYPDMSLRSKTYKNFDAEHRNLAAIERQIKRGWMIEYIFDDYLIKQIEKPIEISRLGDLPSPDQTFIDFANTYQDIYHPVLLKNSEDYGEEGAFMHHCVSGYINTETSIIISLRHKNERVTCEFDIKTSHCIQARAILNQNPPDHYKEALEELYRRVRTFRDNLQPIERRKTRIKINGKEVIQPADLPIVAEPF